MNQYRRSAEQYPLFLRIDGNLKKNIPNLYFFHNLYLICTRGPGKKSVG